MNVNQEILEAENLFLESVAYLYRMVSPEYIQHRHAWGYSDTYNTEKFTMIFCVPHPDNLRYQFIIVYYLGTNCCAYMFADDEDQNRDSAPLEVNDIREHWQSFLNWVGYKAI